MSFPAIAKKKFDLIIFLFIVLYSVLFSYVLYDGKRIEGHLIRLFGSLAFILLSIAISIGPLAYLNAWFRPLVLHRRHIGVTTGIITLTHGLFAWFLNADLEFMPLVNSYFGFSVDKIPFEILGLTSLLIITLMAITSNNFSTAKLGDRWKLIHIFIYPAWFIVILHISLGAVFDDGGSNLFLFLYLLVGLVVVVVAFSLWKTSIQNIPAKKATGAKTDSPEKSNQSYLSRFLPDRTRDALSIDKLISKQEFLRKEVVLDFVGDKLVQGNSSMSILENSLNAGVEHIFECGGNARCSTCRVLIINGLENCLPRNEAELKLSNIKMFSDEVRLACQTHITGDVQLRRLVFDEEDIREAVDQSSDSPPGTEMNLAVLFSDIRSFTPFAENHLPYDVVHMLNKYFNAIGEPIDKNNGYIDKYMGDGIMVVFGLNQEGIDPCVEAVNAAKGIFKALDEVNNYLQTHFNHEFKIGIGIHFGPVIVGEMGYALKKEFTALGDTVNLAARIESKTKGAAGSKILISEEVYKRIKDMFKIGRTFKGPIKGKTGDYFLYEVLLDE